MAVAAAIMVGGAITQGMAIQDGMLALAEHQAYNHRPVLCLLMHSRWMPPVHPRGWAGGFPLEYSVLETLDGASGWLALVRTDRADKQSGTLSTMAGSRAP